MACWLWQVVHPAWFGVLVSQFAFGQLLPARCCCSYVVIHCFVLEYLDSVCILLTTQTCTRIPALIFATHNLLPVLRSDLHNLEVEGPQHNTTWF